MAFDDKTLKRDGSGITPVPQHFNPTTNDYEPVYGRNGASRVEIYGPDGNPISTDDSNKLAVRASEVETLLNDIKGKDFATQTTLSQILAKIIAAPATEAKQDTLIGHVDGVESALAAILAKIIAAPATEAKQDALAALIGEVQASPTANTLLARVKSLEDKLGEAEASPTANTLLARLKSLEDKIDAITDGTSPAVTQLSGSIETVNDNPVTGIKTVTATAAEIFAGGSAKTNRRKLIIKNEDQSLRFRIGKADITQQNGFPVEPGAVVIIPFDPAVIVPIYAISEGASLQASVMEV